MLLLQDPTNQKGPFLLESLTETFRSAEEICGMFAYASAAGIRLLAELEEFRDVVTRGEVDLIVGTDAITNTRAIDALADVVAKYPNVSARAFLNPKPLGTFHPKFCYTKTRNGGWLVAGSGNLTEGGLTGNWEAYSVEELNRQGIAAVEQTWEEWTQKHADCLLPLDDARIRARVALNHVMAREGDLPTLTAEPVPLKEPVASQEVGSEEPETTLLMPPDAAVLIAEIPQSGNRWKQANFDKDNYENFFGANRTRRVLFRHVRSDGALDNYEMPRPPVTVKSRNFRFELAAAIGDYPTTGRPIGVFIRVVGRTFFYRLLLPNDPEYATVDGILTRHADPGRRFDSMRRARMTVATLRTEWATAPFWELPATN